MNQNRYRFDAENHVHLLDNRPLIGTSRVVNVIAKPLAWYGSGQAVKVFGCPEPKVLTKIKNKKASKEEIEKNNTALLMFLLELKEMELPAYLALIDKAYRAHDTFKKERAVSGTDIHAECEKFIHDEIAGAKSHVAGYPEQIRPFIEWSRKNVKHYLWSEGHCYSEKHWIGGISDAGYEKLDGKVGILDFKSTREAYVSQFWQCAGYDLQISENGVVDKDGNVVLTKAYTPLNPIREYCIFAFGADKPKPYFFEDPKGAQEAFLAALTIYKKLPQE